jgi:CRP/FNR family transcriptional regulator, cyclic AMP receptor protein
MDDIRPTRYEAGAIIFKEGDRADGVYLIEIGCVELLKKKGDTKISLGVIGEKQIFGEMAVIDNAPRSATAIAKEETLCYIISNENFANKLSKLEPFMKGMFRILTSKIKAMNEKLS